MMAVRNTLSPRSASNLPDLDPGAFGLEGAGMYEIAVDKQPSATIIKPTRPQVPQKKAHLDEVLRLRKELNDMRGEKKRAEEETNMMVRDLFAAQHEVQEKGDELKRKEAKLQDREEQHKTWKEKAESLSITIQEVEKLAADFKTRHAMQETHITSERENGSQKEEEILRLRSQVKDLTAKEAERQASAATVEKELVSLRGQITQLKATLQEKDTELTTKLSAVATFAADKLQATIQEKQLQSETKLKETEDRLSSELKRQRKLRRAAEAELQAIMKKLTSESSQGLEQRRAVEVELQRTKSNEEEGFQRGAEATLQSTKDQYEAKLKASTKRATIETEALKQGAQTTEASLQEQIEAKSSQEEVFRREAKVTLQKTKDHYEAKLRASTECATIEIEALTQRAQTAEASLQEQSKQKEAEGFHDQLMQWITSLEEEVDQQRRRAEHFKRSSERLSRDIKETQAARRELEQVVFGNKQQLDDHKAQVKVLQQVRGRDMPGEFPT